MPNTAVRGLSTRISPDANRCGAGGKCGYDPAEWMSDKNKCWFANRLVQIKTKYGLSVEHAEANALDAVFATCNDKFDMIFYPLNSSGDVD